MKPVEGTFPPFFANYIQLVKEDHLIEALNHQAPIISIFFDDLPAEMAGFSYAPGKWTLKEMMQHIIDTERIFAYRALSIARKEQQSLPSFDENEYVTNSYAHKREWTALLAEFKLVRKTTEMLFQSFEEEVFQQSGLSSNKPVSVNALGFIIVGHVYHHIDIIKERYLLNSSAF
jgi:hypothetical protein